MRDILYIAAASRPVASSVVALGWVEDGVDGEEADTIRNLAYLADDNIRNAEDVLSLVWMQDGIEEVEAKAMKELAHVSNDSTEAASATIDLPWFRDGIDEMGTGAIDWINNFADPRVALSVLSLEWMREEVSLAELSAIENISYIANDDAEFASSIIGPAVGG